MPVFRGTGLARSTCLGLLPQPSRRGLPIGQGQPGQHSARTIDERPSLMRWFLRVPSLLSAEADLRCVLHPSRLLEIKLQLTTFIAVVGSVIALIAVGQDVATATAVVAACGVASAEITARLLMPTPAPSLH